MVTARGMMLAWLLSLQPSIELLELMGVVRENGNEQMSFPPVVRIRRVFKFEIRPDRV